MFTTLRLGPNVLSEDILIEVERMGWGVMVSHDGSDNKIERHQLIPPASPRI